MRSLSNLKVRLHFCDNIGIVSYDVLKIAVNYKLYIYYLGVFRGLILLR